MKIPAAKHYFFEEDISFILEQFADILRGKSFLSTYKHTEEFEKRFADFIGTRYAVACNSGTSALELICRALGIEGKEVIIPSNTFVATANAVLNAGGKVIFADCDDKMCLDQEDVKRKITPHTAAVIHVHIGGLVSQGLLEVKRLCEEHGLHLIEDAAQAHGSDLGGTKAGAFGVASGFSFFSTKVMTTGEGGMVTTNDAVLVEKMKSMREFGKVKNDIYINYYTSIGYNWRMPEVAALLGLRQLAALPRFIARRQALARLYTEELSGVSEAEIVHPDKGSNHNYFKYILLLPRHGRTTVHKLLAQHGVSPSGYVYEIPLHKQPVFPEFNSLSLPKTEFVCAQHLCLPIFYSMTDEEALYVADTFKKVLKDAPRK